MKTIHVVTLITVTYLIINNALAISFDEAMKSIQNHNSLKAYDGMSQSIEGMGDAKSSWGDPMFKIMAKNLPKDSLKRDQTPMTGIDFSLSQKISLSGKYSKLHQSYQENKKSNQSVKEYELQKLYLLVWSLMARKEELTSKIEISLSSLNWVNKQIRVSERLYANGKIPQQALLDLKVRKSELDGQIIKLRSSLKGIESNEQYLLDSKESIVLASVPWNELKKSQKGIDYKEKSLEQNLRSKELELSSTKRDFIPDMTFSITYTKRENIDGNGNFVGAGVSFPLPFSGQKYGNYSKAVGDRYRSEFILKDYRRKRESQLGELRQKINGLEEELKILNTKTIPFSKNSREISARSYARGGVSYSDLLGGEINLEKFLFKESALMAELRLALINYKFIAGEALYEI